MRVRVRWAAGWLAISLVVIAVISSAFAQFPRPASPWQLFLWAAAAPVASLTVSVLFRAFKRLSALRRSRRLMAAS